LVVGSGAIGIEFASFYHDMGAEVTVVEVLDRVLPVEDEEISAFARKSFEKQGIKIHTEATVAGLENSGDIVKARIAADGNTHEAYVERVVLAVGIVGNVEDIGLEGTGVVIDRTHVVVDEWLRTGEPGVYAIGDLVGPPWGGPPARHHGGLWVGAGGPPHWAPHEGVICVERIAGVNDVHPLDTRNIPACTYCRPQVASVGLTEKSAREAGYEVKVGHFPFIGNGKAIALGEPEGMVKTIFDSKTGELLGAHMVGAEVTELIQGYTIAKALETTETELIRSIFPHPTLSETMHEAVLDAYGRAIHF
jgi:dihydrolipoamide dehydrogenase